MACRQCGTGGVTVMRSHRTCTAIGHRRTIAPETGNAAAVKAHMQAAGARSRDRPSVCSRPLAAARSRRGGLIAHAVNARSSRRRSALRCASAAQVARRSVSISPRRPSGAAERISLDRPRGGTGGIASAGSSRRRARRAAGGRGRGARCCGMRAQGRLAPLTPRE